MSILTIGAVDWSNPISKIGLNDGLVEWWLARGNKIGGTTWFGLRGRYSGTLTNGPTWAASNRQGNLFAMNFDGNDDKVLTNMTATALGTEGTLSCWAKPSLAYNSATPEMLWGLRSSSSPLTQFDMEKWSDNNIVAGFYLSAEYRVSVAASTSNWVQGEWQNYLFTWKNGTASVLYRNGVQIGTGGTSAGITSTEPLQLGNLDTAGAGWAFNGPLDDFRIYNRFATESLAKAIYEDGLKPFPPSLNYIKRTVVRGCDLYPRTTSTGFVIRNAGVNWSSPVNPSYALNNGLSNWWLPSEGKAGGLTLFDLTEHNNGTLTGGPTWEPKAPFKNTLKFDGSDDNIIIAGSRTFTTMTISGWFYITTRKAYQGLVFSRGTSVSGMNIDPGATKLGYTWNNDGSSWTWSGGPTVPANEWVFLCLTVAASEAKAYVWTESGGMLSGTNTLAHASTTIDDLRIGCDDFDIPNRGLVGNAYDVRVYQDKVLTSDEVSELCYETRTGHRRSLNRSRHIIAYHDPLVIDLKLQDKGYIGDTAWDSSKFATNRAINGIDLGTITVSGEATVGPGGALRYAIDGVVLSDFEGSITVSFTTDAANPRLGFGIFLNIQSLTANLGILCDLDIVHGIDLVGDTLHFYGDDAGIIDSYIQIPGFSLGWHHLAFNYIGGFLDVYWDGVYVGTTAGGEDTGVLSWGFVGFSGYTGERLRIPFCGVQVYDKQRTAAQWYTDAQYGKVPSLHLDMKCQDDLTVSVATDDSVYVNEGTVNSPNVDYMIAWPGKNLTSAFYGPEMLANGDEVLLTYPIALGRNDAWALSFFSSVGNGLVLGAGHGTSGSMHLTNPGYIQFSTEFEDFSAVLVHPTVHQGWYHYVLMGKLDGTIDLYLNGVYRSSTTNQRPDLELDAFLGSNPIDVNVSGTLAGLKVYMGNISAAQILQDSNYGGLPGVSYIPGRTPNRLRRGTTLLRM